MQREPAELPGLDEPGGSDVPGERVRRRPDGVHHTRGHRDGRARREDPAQARRRAVGSSRRRPGPARLAEQAVVAGGAIKSRARPAAPVRGGAARRHALDDFKPRSWAAGPPWVREACVVYVSVYTDW